MGPILFRIGTLAVRTYTVLLDLGILAGLALTYWLWRRRGWPASSLLDASACALLGGLIGGRLGYVAVHWSYFSDHLAEALAIWSGGMSFHGAFLAGGLGLWLYSLGGRRGFWEMADLFSAGLALGSVFGWLACHFSGCAYGVVGRGTFFLLGPDIYGIEATRFAVQLAGAAQSALVLAVALVLALRAGRPGLASAVFLILYFGGQAGLESLRGDEAIRLGGWRLWQIIDLVLAAGGLLILIFAPGREPPADEGASDESLAPPAA